MEEEVPAHLKDLCHKLVNAAPVVVETAEEQRDRCPRLRIAVLSDFCYPRKGGVETHQYSLAQELIRRGHKVICITNTYNRGSRQGVRYMAHGLKMYYLPLYPVIQQAFFPVFFVYLSLLRCVLLRERIDLVHCHQAPSFLAELMLVHCHTLGVATVFTDHSLFGFGDIISIHLNKLMKFSLSECSQVIAVSHASKENVTLRACLDPNRVSVIPNAVDCCKFFPQLTAESSETPILSSALKDDFSCEIADNSSMEKECVIVMIQRLAYRKGMSLACEVIPEVCKRVANCRFEIGGDGPMRVALEQMIEANELHSRVKLLGAIEHSQVRDVLIGGHLFLSLSLTEAFCIAVVEAASCGLYVVSTDVGGVSEVLPPETVRLGKADCHSMVASVLSAIPKAMAVTHTDKLRFHSIVKSAYSWQIVAKRTEPIYKRCLEEKRSKTRSLAQRVAIYRRIGPVSGLVMAFIVVTDYLMLCFIQWLIPADSIEVAVDFPPTQFGKCLW